MTNPPCCFSSRFVGAMLLCVLFASPVPARVTAQDSAPAERDTAAKNHFARGRAAYERGDFKVALDAFQAAYASSQHPKLLYNVGLASQKLGLVTEAITAFESYLAWGEGDRADEVKGRLTALRDQARQPPPTPAEAAASAPVEPSPPPSPVDSDPPKRSRRGWWIAGGIALAAAVVIGVAAPLSQRNRATLEEPETNTGLSIRALSWGAQ